MPSASTGAPSGASSGSPARALAGREAARAPRSTFTTWLRELFPPLRARPHRVGLRRREQGLRRGWRVHVHRDDEPLAVEHRHRLEDRGSAASTPSRSSAVLRGVSSLPRTSRASGGTAAQRRARRLGPARPRLGEGRHESPAFVGLPRRLEEQLVRAPADAGLPAGGGPGWKENVPSAQSRSRNSAFSPWTAPARASTGRPSASSTSPRSLPRRSVTRPVRRASARVWSRSGSASWPARPQSPATRRRRSGRGRPGRGGRRCAARTSSRL